MAATVYFADMHSRSHEDSKLAKLARLCDAGSQAHGPQE